jgi:anti-sigma factor RsiW
MHEKYGCREVVKLLSDYIDGECTSEMDALIEGHLADCPNCIAFVNTLRKSVSMTRALAYEDIPKELNARLHRVLGRRIPMEDLPPEVREHPFDEPGLTREEEERL